MFLVENPNPTRLVAPSQAASCVIFLPPFSSQKEQRAQQKTAPPPAPARGCLTERLCSSSRSGSAQEPVPPPQHWGYPCQSLGKTGFQSHLAAHSQQSAFNHFKAKPSIFQHSRSTETAFMSFIDEESICGKGAGLSRLFHPLGSGQS